MDDLFLPGAACERRTVITPNVFAVIPCYVVPGFQKLMEMEMDGECRFRNY